MLFYKSPFAERLVFILLIVISWISDTKIGKRTQKFRFLLNFVIAVIDNNCNKLSVNVLALNIFIKVVRFLYYGIEFLYNKRLERSSEKN